MKDLLKYIWLSAAIIAFILSIHSSIKNGFSESYPLYIITAIAVVMFLFRKKINKLPVKE